MTRKQLHIITFLSLAIMVLLVLLTRRLWLRFDLTSSRAYTLSPASRMLREEIEETLKITYYLSGKLKAMYPEPSEIADLLREYQARSRGKIEVSVKDPGGDMAEAERFGLQPQQFQDVGEAEARFSVVYSGIVIEYLDKYEVLPWIFSLDTLEYDVTGRIRALVNGRRRELGLIAPEARKNWNEYYGYFNQALVQSGFFVLPIRPGEEIPDTLPALFVLGGAEELDEASLYRIDRYIQLGGRALFALEGVDVDIGSWEGRVKEDPPGLAQRGLLDMVSSYGVTVGRSLVLDRSSLPVPYQDPYTQRMQLVRYAPWVGVMQNQAEDHLLTSGFGGVDLFWASPLALNLPGTGAVKGNVLFRSSPEAWLMTKNFALQPEMNASFAAEMENTRGEQILAAALEGRFPSWFEGREKPRLTSGDWNGDEWEAAETELPAMPGEAKESRIVVVGDSDLGGALSMQYYQAMSGLGLAQSSGLNFNFLLQAADWLGNDDDIVGIRNRQGGSPRLDKIADEGRRLALMAFSRTLNIVIVPLIIVIFGLVRLLKRKYKKEQDHAL